MDFFNNTPNTFTIDSTQGRKTFGAMDIAKVVAFGKRTIHWDGSDTWISRDAMAYMLADFCTQEGEERDQLRKQLTDMTDLYTNTEDRDFINLLDEANRILLGWATSKLYTCVKNGHINLDKLESLLGIELGDTVRMRLSQVEAYKSSDGDWVFNSASSKSYRETATIGVLTEIRDAVNFFEDNFERCINLAKQGYKTLEEMGEASYSIDLERWTCDDIDDMVDALKAANTQPDPYTVYLTRHYDFSVCKSEDVEGQWDFQETIKEFDTHHEAVDFRTQANKCYAVQKKRNMFEKNIASLEEQLENARKEYAQMIA